MRALFQTWLPTSKREILSPVGTPACHKNCETRQSLCITKLFYSIQTSKNAFRDKAKCNIPLRFTFVVCYLTILDWSKYTVPPISPSALPDFPAYMDASEARDFAAVFGSQWPQWQWPSERSDTGTIARNYFPSFLLAYLSTISIFKVIMQA